MQIEQIKQNFEDNGFAKFTDLLINNLKPTLYMTLQEQESSDQRGVTRLGGYPDAPKDFVWPKNDNGLLAFMLQINIADIPENFRKNLPATGLLSIFVGTDDYIADYKLFLFCDSEACERYEIDDIVLNDYMDYQLPSYKLGIKQALALPAWYSEEYYKVIEQMRTLGLTEMQEEEYEQLVLSLEPMNKIVGRMFGYYRGIGCDPIDDIVEEQMVMSSQTNCFEEQYSNSWMHFLTVDTMSGIGLNIGDAGYLQCLIKEQDFEQLNFDNVYMAMESS